MDHLSTERRQRNSMRAMLAAGRLIVAAGLITLIGAGAHAQGENRVTEGAKVLIEFTITVPEENTVIPNNVAQYVPGRHELIPALEAALMGLKPGEQKRVDLPADQAFGPYDEKKKTTIKREELPPDLKPGTVLRTQDGRPFTVLEVTDSSAVVDFNHPLAGKHLVVDVKVLNVQHPS